jgi:uncharacterized protein
MTQQATAERIQELVRELQEAGTASKKFELSTEIARASQQLSGSSTQNPPNAVPTRAVSTDVHARSARQRRPVNEDEVVDEITVPVTQEEVVVEKRQGTKFQIYQDRKGEYRWRLRARNGEIIADGNEGYRSKASCELGIDLVKQQAASAEVEDQTEEQAAQADRTE